MNSTNQNAKSIFDDIIAKLSPKVVALLVGMALLLLAIIIGIAVLSDKDVDLFGIKISEPSKACQEDLARCEEYLGQSIKLSEMQEIVGVPLTRTQAIDTLRALIKCAGQVDEWRDNFNYRMLELERQMQRFGGSISTRIIDSSRIEAYRMIQSVLSDVGFYEGELNGEQSSTYQALAAFQTDYNQRVPENERIAPVGSFGYQTLEAVRSRYRQISG